MQSYKIQLLETRLGEEGTDDVALFDVSLGGNGHTERVPVFMSPLFRWLQMDLTASEKRRHEMVASLGARAIVERLRQGQKPPFEEQVVLASIYPGAPGPPDPLSTYESISVNVP
jgi:hypothetical protein